MTGKTCQGSKEKENWVIKSNFDIEKYLEENCGNKRKIGKSNVKACDIFWSRSLLENCEKFTSQENESFKNTEIIFWYIYFESPNYHIWNDLTFVYRLEQDFVFAQ